MTRAAERVASGCPGGARQAAVAVFLLALLLRAVYLLELEGSLPLAALVGDGRQYWAWAQEILSAGWWGEEVFYQAPLYPYFLAAVSALFGSDPGAVRWVQAVLGATSCLLVCLAGCRFFSPRAGVVAGALLAIYPAAIFFDGLIQKTSLGLFLTALLLWLLALLAEKPGGGLWLVTGAVLGALALTRENALLFAPLLTAWILLQVGSISARAAWLASFGLGLALVLAPVGLRNWAVGGRFLMTTAQLGPNLYIGNHAEADGKYQPLRPGREDARVERQDAASLAEADLGRSLSAAEVSRYWLDRSLQWIRSDPGSWARLLGRKALLVLNGREILDSESIEVYQEHSRLLRWVAWWHFGVLVPLGVLGVWVTRRDWRRLLILYAVALAVLVGVVLFYVLARYRFPLVPVLVLFAGAGLLEVVVQARRRSWAALARYGAVVGAAAVVANLPLGVRTGPRATNYYNLGMSLFEQGEDERAAAALERAVAVLTQGPYGGLLTEGPYGSLLTEGPYGGLPTKGPYGAEAAHAYYQLGRVRAALGDRSAAVRSLNEALRLEPGHAGAHVELALQLLQAEELGGAEEHLRRAIALEPATALTHGLLGNLLAHRGLAQEAVREYEAALTLDPALADARFKLGSLLLETGEPAAARPHLAAAVRLLPEFAEGHRRLATALGQLGEVDGAVRHYRRVLELRPGDRDAERALASLAGAAPG